MTDTAERAQNRFYTDRHVTHHFRNTIITDSQILCHVDSVGHHFHFWREESSDLLKLDKKPVHHPLSGNHLLTCTAATGNFGEVTPGRVGNKTKETPMGRNRNAHQHFPKLFLYVPPVAPAMHFTEKPLDPKYPEVFQWLFLLLHSGTSENSIFQRLPEH